MNTHELLPQTELNCPIGMDVLFLGGGCFWCTEAVFLRLNGVVKVVPGYAGGILPNPSYEAICTGATGHAEVIQVIFDPKLIALQTILTVFWATHDPTTLNRQGADVGPQYRSSIFYTSLAQGDQAKDMKDQLTQAKIYPNPLVTEITPFSNFYPAEQYHHDYYALHGQQPYCQFVVRPKVEKLQQLFAELLKK
uniref:peptide-methionine (S)-S-oxide reductase MsrA n=1 Tax=Algoriphagus sp. TaxID=1872435 RepID=UPI004047A44F